MIDVWTERQEDRDLHVRQYGVAALSSLDEAQHKVGCKRPRKSPSTVSNGSSASSRASYSHYGILPQFAEGVIIKGFLPVQYALEDIVPNRLPRCERHPDGIIRF